MTAAGDPGVIAVGRVRRVVIGTRVGYGWGMQERAKKHSPAERADEETGSAAPAAPSDAGERIKAELDDILDEIDGVLEENAEEFVKNYVQKGGE